MILIIAQSNTCFGDPFDDIVDEILACEHLNDEGRHIDNDLSADARYLPVDTVEEQREVIPNSLIVVDADLVVETKMEDYLNGITIPKPATVVAFVDEPDYPDIEQQLKNVRYPIEIVTSRPALIQQAEYYFKTICPECNGQAARTMVHQWCKGVYNRIEN